MPNTPQYKIRKGKLIWNNWLGLTPAGPSRTNLRLGESYHLADANGIDPLIIPGTLSPGLKAGTDLDTGNKISAIISNIFHYQYALGSNAYAAYYVEEGAKFHKNDSTGSGQTDNMANYPVSIVGQGGHAAHTTFVGDDNLVFKANGSYVNLVSYNDGTDGDVANISLDGGTTDMDWFSTRSGSAALGKFPHKLLEGPNGFLYVTDGPSIHKYDGSTDAVSLSAIDLPAGWVIYDAVDHKGFMWIFAVREVETIAIAPPPRKAGVFVWNYISNKSGSFSGFERGTPFLIDNTMKLGRIFIHNGVPHTLSFAANYRTQLRRFNGSSFDIVWEEPGDYLPNRGGVISRINQITWLSKSNGIICSYGSIGSGYPEVFNKPGVVGNSGGAMTQDSAGNIWAAHDTTELHKLSNGYDSASAYLLIKDLPQLAEITGIHVYYTPASDSTASALSFTFYTKLSSSVSGTYQIVNSTDGARGYKYFPLGGANWSNANMLQMILTWSSQSSGVGVSPYRIEVDYQVKEKLL